MGVVSAFAAGPPDQYGGMGTDDLGPSERERLSGPGLRSFLRIADVWALSDAEARTLLGEVSAEKYAAWKAGAIDVLDGEQLRRLSLILGIYKGLTLLFLDPEVARRWLKSNNSDFPFNHRSPLRSMMEDQIAGLYGVRRYLDGWRGVWP